MPLYTRTGDDGNTGLRGGQRVSKSAARVEAYGAIDELNATLGWSRAAATSPLDELLQQVQRELFVLAAELATDPTQQDAAPLPEPIAQPAIHRLEAEIDQATQVAGELRTFVLPGGCESAARLHIARAVCRRAERRLVALAATESVRPELLRYLNRLSDWLFAIARAANHHAGIPETPWP